MSPHRFSPACIALAAWIAAPSPTRAAEMHLKAVKRNGVPITPTSTVGAMPGDLITAEIFVCGWNADEAGSRVRTYQATLDVTNGATSGEFGIILPNGWDAPIFPETCNWSSDCTDPEYPICWYAHLCVGPDFNPGNPYWSQPDGDGTFIEFNRPDFMFFGQFPPLPPPASFWQLDVALGCLSTGPLPSDPGCGNPKYGGTVNFRVGSDACGDFEFLFRTQTKETFLELTQGPHDPDTIFVEPTTAPLTIRVGSHCDRPVRPIDSSCHADMQNTSFSCAMNDECGVAEACATKSRFVSFRVNARGPQGDSDAIRVKVVDSPDPDMIGDTWWVGPIFEAGDARTTLIAAPLECTRAPYERDWSALEGVHIFGEAIVPGARYEVSLCRAGKCLMPTVIDTAVYGDVAAPFGAGQPNFGDISAQVAKFQGAAGQISLTRALIRPSLLDPSQGTSFVQISATVSAFQGFAYSDPPSTPGANRCP